MLCCDLAAAAAAASGTQPAVGGAAGRAAGLTVVEELRAVLASSICSPFASCLRVQMLLASDGIFHRIDI